MLINISGLNKTYKTSGGVTHRALANINLQFDDSGMVFIVGKSGSGKSTMLNMLGALDRYDSGTLTVGGKNLGMMSGRELDNYRNTMVGFIFQEPNLIENLSVQDNVKLVLNLQKAPKAGAHARQVLEMVGLTEKLWTNVQNLSGGQRQRVSIARALAKNPRIMLADEPTGALDVATGESIMSLLKQISSDRLVIVVTHDMDMATQYGDRIIEMKDSRIYRDIMPRPENYVERNADITFVSDTIVKVAPGERFDDHSTAKLNAILSEGGRKTFLNFDTDKKKMKALFPNLREAIDADVRQTDENGIESMGKFVPYEAKSNEQARIALKKGRLPLSNALGFGLNNLKHRKVRLVFTILMTVITLALFGFSQTINMFDENRAYASTAIESGYASIHVCEAGTSYVNNSQIKLKTNELNAIVERTGHIVNYTYSYVAVLDDYPYSFNGFTEVKDAASLGLTEVSGDVSFHDMGKTDIVISSDAAGDLVKAGVATSTNRLVGQVLSINGTEHTIKGIYQSADSSDSENWQFVQRSEYMLVADGYRELFIDTYSVGNVSYQIKVSDDESDDKINYINNAYVLFDSEISEWMATDNNMSAIIYDGITGGGTRLSSGEIFIGSNVMFELGLVVDSSDSWGDSSTGRTINDFNAYEGKDLLLYSSSDIYFGYATQSATPLYASNQFRVKGVISPYYGISVDNISSIMLESCIVFSEEDRDVVLANALSSYEGIIGLNATDEVNESMLYSLLSSGYTLNESFVSSYASIVYMLESMSVVMLIVAGVLCLVTALMLYGYLSASIKLTSKQIGILRALGAKLTDCFKIYVIEALLISLMSGALAIIAIAIVSPIVNAAMTVELGFNCFLLQPTAGVFFMILGIALVVSIVSVILPLRKLTKISPVEAIFGKK